MRYATVLFVALCSAACSHYPANLPSIKPYKLDIQQGNVVTSKMMMQLRPGMSRSQVRFIMGTPLIADSFHANRWDYLYRMQKDGKLVEQRHVILEFEDDKLARVRGDVIPATGETAAPEQPAGGKVITIAPKPKEKGALERLKFWGDDEAQAAPAPAEKAPATAEPADAPAPQPAAEAATGETLAVQPALTAPAPQPAAPGAPATAAAGAPAGVAAEPAAAAPAPAPAAAADDELPPEDDPGYFERMLEKIGF